MIFDSHAHYDDHSFDGDRDEVLTDLAAKGVGTVVNICAEADGIPGVLELAERYPFIYAAVGVHPSEVAALDESVFARVEEAAAHPRVVAVGEIGLDYHYPEPSRQLQRKWFLRQLDLAERLHLPVVIHSRDAAQDTLDIMRSAGRHGIPGVIHCFSGSVEFAREYLAMGYYLGIGGVLTFKNGKTLREVVKMAPLEQLLLETDAPYLTPEPYRGKRNDSRYLPMVARVIGELKGVSEEEVIRVTEKNARTLYRIPGEDGDAAG